MADDKDYTSLLGRSSGASWGDIAGAYLSGGKKKDSRARNVLLATLFFNAKEANMQSKVLKQIEDLESSKAIDIAKAKEAYKKGLELETQYNSVMSNPNGIYGYYKKDAESAFNNYLEQKGMDVSLYDGTNTSANKQKSEFMRNWSNERHNNFMKVYNPQGLQKVKSLGIAYHGIGRF